MKIITLMPTRGIILTEVLDSLDKELSANKQMPFIVKSNNMPLPVSRNYLVETALKLDFWDYALLLDDDVIMPTGGLQELIKLNADIAVIDYPMHSKMNNKWTGTVVRDKDKSIAWAGLGCCLVKRKVLEELPQPQFVFVNHRITRDNDGRIGFFSSQTQGENKFSGGEDVNFFLQARKHKFTIKVAKKIAKHAHIEHFVSPISTTRYQTSHKIVVRDTIEGEVV